jgi:IMP dehydrogenase
VRDVVEIGMGREARRAYDLAQVEIVPSRRTRSSQEVSTAWQLDAYRFEIPLMTHPTDAVVSPDIAVAIGQLGGLSVLNAEGLWARHGDAEGALAQVLEAAADEEDPGAAVRVL